MVLYTNYMERHQPKATTPSTDFKPSAPDHKPKSRRPSAVKSAAAVTVAMNDDNSSGTKGHFSTNLSLDTVVGPTPKNLQTLFQAVLRKHVQAGPERDARMVKRRAVGPFWILTM